MEIRKIFLSVFFVFLLVYNNAAVARVVSGYYAGTELSLLEDLDVLPTGYMFYDNIYVDKPIIINNNGIIEADINVRDGYEVKIQNSGTIKGSVNLGNKSNLVQIVYTEKDNAYNLREEIKKILAKEYRTNKKPTAKFIEKFSNKYEISIPNDLFFDAKNLFNLF